MRFPVHSDATPGCYAARMTWLLIFAALVVLLVGGAILPRRAAYRGQEPEDPKRPGFPWFWILFPLTVFAIALGFAAWLPGTAATGADFGWTMYMPLADAGDGFDGSLSSDAAVANLLRMPWARITYLLIAVAGLALSVWAWRKRRI